jgi:hypothetical protein
VNGGEVSDTEDNNQREKKINAESAQYRKWHRTQVGIALPEEIQIAREQPPAIDGVKSW